jgi:hypothetical protein
MNISTCDIWIWTILSLRKTAYYVGLSCGPQPSEISLMNAIFVMLNGSVSVRNFYIGFSLCWIVYLIYQLYQTLQFRGHTRLIQTQSSALLVQAQLWLLDRRNPLCIHSYGTFVLPPGVILSFTNDRQTCDNLIYKMIGEWSLPKNLVNLSKTRGLGAVRSSVEASILSSQIVTITAWSPVGGVTMLTIYSPVACWSFKLSHCTLFGANSGPVVYGTGHNPKTDGQFPPDAELRWNVQMKNERKTKRNTRLEFRAAFPFHANSFDG